MTQIGAIHINCHKPLSFTQAIGTITLAKSTQTELAEALGLSVDDLMYLAYWVNSGAMQLLLRLNDLEQLQRVKPTAKLATLCQQARQPCVVYLWVKDVSGAQVTSFHARLLAQVLGEFWEYSGRDSVCANLGTWLVQHKRDSDVCHYLPRRLFTATKSFIFKGRRAAGLCWW